LLVTAHAHPLAAIRDALAAGVDAIEHARYSARPSRRSRSTALDMLRSRRR
jgi:hypothetical protein